MKYISKNASSRRLVLLQLLLGMLLSHVRYVHAHDDLDYHASFTTVYCRCQRKNDVYWIHQIETFFGSSHLVKDRNGFYIDKGITVIPPDQYPCSQYYKHHHDRRDLQEEEFEDDNDNDSPDEEEDDDEDVEEHDSDVKVDEFELAYDQHGILRQEQYVHYRLLDDRFLDDAHHYHRRLMMISGKSDNDASHSQFKGAKGESKVSLSSSSSGSKKKSGSGKKMMMTGSSFHYDYGAMSGDTKTTKYKDYYYFVGGKKTTLKKDHDHGMIVYTKTKNMHNKGAMKHRWKKMKGKGKGKGKGGGGEQTKGKGKGVLIGWEIFKCPVMPQPQPKPQPRPTRSPAAANRPTRSPAIPATPLPNLSPTTTPTSTFIPTTTTALPTSTFVPTTTAPISGPTASPTGPCIGTNATFTTTIILDIDNFEAFNASQEEITALENVLRDAYQNASGCDTPGAFINILNVSLVTNVTDAFGDPIVPIPWAFEIETECNGCNGTLFVDDDAQNPIDNVCRCSLPTLSAYLLACNEILTKQPLPNIDRIRNVQVLTGVGGIGGGGAPFTFQTFTSITLSCRLNSTADCLGPGSIKWLELYLPIIYNRKNAFNLELCDPAGRVVTNATFIQSAGLNNGTLLSIVFELTATCRGPNCVSQTVVFGNHVNTQGDDDGAAAGGRLPRHLLDISSVCPVGVDLRCPSTKEFADELQAEIDKRGDSLPFDRVDNVTETSSFIPSTPSPISPSPPPPTPTPSSPTTAGPSRFSSTATPTVSPSATPTVSVYPTPIPSPVISGNWERVMVLIERPEDAGTGGVRSISFSSDASLLAVGQYGSNASGILRSGTCLVYAIDVINNTTSIVAEFSGSFQNAWYGHDVALTADGRRLLCSAYPLGVSSFFAAVGFANIFQDEESKNDGTWSRVGEQILPQGNDGLNGRTGGRSFAMSADGTTTAIGYINDYNTIETKGLVSVYRFLDGAWTEIGAGTALQGDLQFGKKLALSGDGNAIIVTTSGSPRVFEYSSPTDEWKQTGTDLLKDFFSTSVAISEHGKRIAIHDIPSVGRETLSGIFDYNATSNTWDETFSGFTTDAEAYEVQDIILKGTTGNILGIAMRKAGGASRVFQEISKGNWAQLGNDTNVCHIEDFVRKFGIALSNDGRIAALTAARWHACSSLPVGTIIEIHRFVPST